MISFTNLELYKIVFTLEILVGMFLFSSQMKKRTLPWLRYPLCSIACLVLAMFFPVYEEFSYTWWYSSLMFFSLFLACFLSLCLIIKAPFKKLFLIGVATYTAQHLSYQIYTCLCYAFRFDDSLQAIYSSDTVDLAFSVVNFLRIVITIIVYALIYVCVFNIYIVKIKDENKISNFSIVVISALILLIDIIANSIVVYNDDGHNIVTSLVICGYNILSCLLVFFILYFIVNIRSLRSELLIKTVLLEQAEAKYEQSKANVDLINIKCHDLKHQIRTFGEKKTLDKDTVKEIEGMIEIYDSTMHTGNKALDIILMEKKLLCSKKGIALKCYADCSRLSYVTDVDFYSLFGNAIDNAIEAVEGLADEEKKNINVLVKNFNDFVSVVIENYYQGNIVFGVNRMPQTTKTDKLYHGFGLKSIQSIADKYEASLSITARDGIFRLSLLFPAARENPGRKEAQLLSEK